MYLFNEEFGDKYLLKSLNAAQDGPDSDEWWINGLLIFNVDGSAHERDKNNWFLFLTLEMIMKIRMKLG